MRRNNDYTLGNLLDYYYLSKHYKLIAIYLTKQIELENPDLNLCGLSFSTNRRRLRGSPMDPKYKF